MTSVVGTVEVLAVEVAGVAVAVGVSLTTLAAAVTVVTSVVYTVEALAV